MAMAMASRDFWDERARLDIGLHAVMTKRWTDAQCVAVHQQMQAVIVGALREGSVDVTTWLDLGCGTGRFLDLPFTVGPGVENVVGVDLSSEMCRRAVRNRRRDPRVQVVQATGSALPLADATVTCALSVAVLQHQDLATLQSTGSEVSRVLTCGGTLLVLEGTRDAQGDEALAGTTAVTLHSIDDFRDAFGAGLSITSTTHVTLIDDRYTCLIWRKHR